MFDRRERSAAGAGWTELAGYINQYYSRGSSVSSGAPPQCWVGWAGLAWLSKARARGASLIRLSLGKTNLNGVQPTLITLRMAGTAEGVVGRMLE